MFSEFVVDATNMKLIYVPYNKKLLPTLESEIYFYLGNAELLLNHMNWAVSGNVIETFGVDNTWDLYQFYKGYAENLIRIWEKIKGEKWNG